MVNTERLCGLFTVNACVLAQYHNSLAILNHCVILSVFHNFLCALVTFEASSLVIYICVMYEKITNHWWFASDAKKLTFLNHRALMYRKHYTCQQLLGMPLKIGLQVSSLGYKNFCHRHFYLSAEWGHVLNFCFLYTITLIFIEVL